MPFNPNKSFVELKICEFSVYSTWNTYIKSKKKCEKKNLRKVNKHLLAKVTLGVLDTLENSRTIHQSTIKARALIAILKLVQTFENN